MEKDDFYIKMAKLVESNFRTLVEEFTGLCEDEGKEFNLASFLGTYLGCVIKIIYASAPSVDEAESLVDDTLNLAKEPEGRNG